MEAPAVAKPRLLSVAIAAVLAAPAAQAATITVNSPADPGSPGDSVCTLREAIANANANSDTTDGDCTAGSNPDTIVFDSLVTGTITLSDSQLEITDDLTINGPGAEQLAVDGDGRYRVFRIAADKSVTIDGLTIENGSTTDGGGGISGADATLTLTNSTVSGNSASYGGGILAYDATLTNSTVSGNIADTAGGGGLNAYFVTLTNSTVSGNTAAGYGGGISAYTAVLSESTVSGNSAGADGAGGIGSYFTTLDNSTVSNNTTAGDGGGIRGFSLGLYSSNVSGNVSNGNNGGLDFGYATITDSVITHNRAAFGAGGGYAFDTTLSNSTVSGNSTGGFGGGLDAYYARVSNSTIAGNSAAYDGGGAFVYDATLTNSTVSGNSTGGYGGGLNAFNATVSNSTIAGNSAAYDGGGVYSFAEATLTNSTLSGNSARYGGALYAYSASITNSTLWGNTASGYNGGGFFGETIELTNTIIAGSTAGDCDALYATSSSSLIEDGSCDATLFGDPELAALTDNGCVTPAGAPGGAACVQSHALLTGSPAIDPSAASCPTPNDQREATRDSNCDLGAYEAIATAACGSADAAASLSAPTGALCAIGTPTPPMAMEGGWGWTCEVTDGTPADCRAAGASAGDGNATLGFEVEGKDCTVSARAVAPPAGGPPGVTMPFGAFTFTAGDDCDSVTVEATFSGPVAALQLYKYINGAWATVSGASLTGNTIRLTIEDNGPYDANRADGVITDPFGPGRPHSGGGGAPAPIPALSGAGLLTLLAGLLGLGGFYARRRR